MRSLSSGDEGEVSLVAPEYGETVSAIQTVSFLTCLSCKGATPASVANTGTCRHPVDWANRQSGLAHSYCAGKCRNRIGLEARDSFIHPSLWLLMMFLVRSYHYVHTRDGEIGCDVLSDGGFVLYSLGQLMDTG